MKPTRFLILIFLSVFVLDSESASAARKSKRKKRKKSEVTKEMSEAPDESSQDSDVSTKKNSSFGILGLAGLDTLKSDESTSGKPLSGYGFGALAHYRVKASPSFYLPVGGGIRISSLSQEENNVKGTLSVTTMRIDLGGLFAATPTFHIGGYFGYDILLTGAYNVTATIGDEEISISRSLASFSQTVFGARGLFLATKSIYLGADYGVTSGTLKLQAEESEDGEEAEEPEAVKFSGSQMTAFIGIMF